MIINETFHWLWLAICQQFHTEGWLMVLEVAQSSYLGSCIGLGEQWDQKISLPFVLGTPVKRQMGRRRSLWKEKEHDGWGTCTKAAKGGALRKLFRVFLLHVLPVYEVSYKNCTALGPRIFKRGQVLGYDFSQHGAPGLLRCL